MAKSKTRYAILGMISLGPKSGYDIKKNIEEEFSLFWSESFGQIYKVFKTLEKEKLVEKQHVRQKGKPSKDLYSITEKGREELKSYLSRPPEKLVVRDELMLKLIFGFNVDKEKSIELLEYELERISERLEHVQCSSKEKMLNLPDPKVKTYLNLIAKLGTDLLKTKIKWCKEAGKMLRELNN